MTVRLVLTIVGTVNDLPRIGQSLKDRVKAVRFLLGLDHAQLGKILGVEATTVYYWELGYSEPPRSALLALDYLEDGYMPRAPWEQSSAPTWVWLVAWTRAFGVRPGELATYLGVTPKTASRYLHGRVSRGLPRHVLIAAELLPLELARGAAL